MINISISTACSIHHKKATTPTNKLPTTLRAGTAYPAAPFPLSILALALAALADAALALLLAAAPVVVVADTLNALVTAVPACDKAELRPGSFEFCEAIDESADVACDCMEAREEALEEA